MPDGRSSRVLAIRAERAALLLDDGAGGRVVVKISSTPDGLRREIEARTLLRGHGLPVGAPVSCHSGPPAVLTLPWVEGRPVDEATCSAALRDVGRLLARVHAIDGSGPFAGNVTWSGWMRGWVAHACDWWDSVCPSAAGEMTPLSTWCDRLSDSMDARATRTILFDGRPEHFLVDTSDAGSTVSMIDVEELRGGDPAMDLAVLQLWAPCAASEVLRGYAESETAAGTSLDAWFDEQFHERIRFYVALRALAAAEWHADVLDDHRTSSLMKQAARKAVDAAR